MAIRKIEEWKHIFLDTSVIIDLLLDPKKFDKNPGVQKRIELTQKLFDYFKINSNEENRFVFYVSAITISELTKKIHDEPIVNTLIQMFTCADITFVDFTKDIATLISSNIKNYLPNKTHINQLLSKLGDEIKDDSIINIRNWVSDDLKIVVSAKYLKKLDVVLTADQKTFIPIAEFIDIPVLYTAALQLDLFNNINTETVY